MPDAASHARFEAERGQHFPASRNIVPAHVTMFHHLPGGESAAIGVALERSVAALAPVPFRVTGLRFLGRGSAYALDMPELAGLRRRLASQWQPWLTAQDRQAWRPHVTVQNKVHPDEAKRTYATLSAAFSPWAGQIVRMDLWRYLGGPWEAVATYAFPL